MNRRNFLSGVLAGAATVSTLSNASTLGGELDRETKPLEPAKQYELKGNLLTLGAHAELFASGGPNPLTRKASVLTSMDLETGDALVTPLPMNGEGHLAMGLGDGRILCTGHHQTKSMVVDAEHQIVKTFEAPDPYLYGGHGLVLAEKGILILPMRHKSPKSTADTGRLEIYDIKTLELLQTVDSGGVHPHEPQYLADTDELVVSHYGDVHIPLPPFQHNVQDGKLTVYDLKTFKVKRNYMQNDLRAMTTHMQISNDGYAYFVLTQYVRPDMMSQDISQAWAIAEQQMAMHMGRPRDYVLPYRSLTENRLSVPLPFVRVNMRTGERELILTEPGNHLRGQTVGLNRLTNTAIAVFFHSDKVILHRGGEDPIVVDGAVMGITDMRGVVDIPGTPYVALSGAYKNLAIMDVRTGEFVRRYQSDNYYSVHVGYSPKA